MVRFLLFLLGTISAGGSRRPATAPYAAGDPPGWTDPASWRDPAALPAVPGGLPGAEAWPGQAGWPGPRDSRAAGGRATDPPPSTGDGPGRRRRLRPWVMRTAVVVALGLIFRRAIASLVLAALSAALHVVGINVHLPSVRFGWPWQAASAGSSTSTDLGPWVLQKIEGISRPALGEANFTFTFSHKVSKSIGPWPCWYASTFYAVARASATVDLNPGPSWWTPASGHYRLQVLSRPRDGKPGQVSVTMILPRPQLPQTAHDVTIDNIPSRPIDVQHSWTYPGFGCGLVLRPQFAESVLYAEAQQKAFRNATRDPSITRPLVASAEAEAAQTIRDNFIQPTVNAFGYTLDQLTVRWAGAS